MRVEAGTDADDTLVLWGCAMWMAIATAVTWGQFLDGGRTDDLTLGEVSMVLGALLAVPALASDLVARRPASGGRYALAIALFVAFSVPVVRYLTESW